MSTTQGAFGGARDERRFGPGDWSDAPWRRGDAHWTAFEIIAMVLGFIVFWPIGLAILGYKIWTRRNGGPDLRTAATSLWNNARSAVSETGAPTGATAWTRGFTPSTGNRAFDEWKSAELERLEAERRKLEAAHREFAEFLDTVRKARDREEFERFMNERRARQG